MKTSEEMYNNLIERKSQYEKMQDQRRRKAKNIFLPIISVCVLAIFVFGILGLSHQLYEHSDVKPTEFSIESTKGSYVTQAETRMETRPETCAETSIDLDEVLFAPSNEEVGPDEWVPDPGNIIISSTLETESTKGENKDKYFAVSITVFHFDFVEAYQEEQYDKYMTALNAPILVKYREDYEIWVETVVRPAIPEENLKDEAYMYNFEEKWYNSKQSYDEFDEYWKEHQNADVWDEYLEARRTHQEAWDEYMDYTVHENEILKELFSADIEAEMQVELDRLKNLGYAIELATDKENTLSGYLTGEQLCSFPCSPKHGYIINWNGQEEPLDE